MEARTFATIAELVEDLTKRAEAAQKEAAEKIAANKARRAARKAKLDAQWSEVSR